MQIARSRFRLGFVVLLAGGSAIALVATPPQLTAGSWSRGDDLALAAAWAVALAASVWLFTTTAACLVAIGARRPQLARALGYALPPALRRAVEIAVVASCLTVSAAPAHAANTGPVPLLDQPVVRAPKALALPSTSRPRVTPTTRPSPVRAPAAPTTTALPRRPPSPVPSTPRAGSRDTAPEQTTSAGRESFAEEPPSSPAATVPAPSAPHVVVRPGDNLWTIARAELIRATGAPPNDMQVARYWRSVIDVNRATLRSGNPGLIFPGEIVALPPAPPVS